MDPELWAGLADLAADADAGVLRESGQILVVDDDAARAAQIISCLWALNPFAARSLTTGETLSAEAEEVAVVLVSLEEPYDQRLMAAARMLRTVGARALVGYGAADELECQDALRLAGGWDPIPYPFSPRDLAQAVRSGRLRAMKYAGAVRPGPRREEQRSVVRLVAVCNPKGGVGASTLAVNLACCLAGMEAATALVDADLEFGSHHIFLDLRPSESILYLADQAEEITGEAVEEALLAHSSGVRVLLSPPWPELAERISPAHLNRILKLLRARYRITIVDAGSPTGSRAWAVMEVADVVLVPLVPELPAIRVFQSFMYEAARQDIGAARIVPVLMRADTAEPARLAAIQSMLGISFPWHIRSDGRRVLASVTEGKPFVLSAPRTPLSEEVRALATALLTNDGKALLAGRRQEAERAVRG